MKTYEMQDGTRCTVPENDRTDPLVKALKDNLSPEAVAAIAAYLQVRGMLVNAKVRKEIDWFERVCTDAVGGDEAWNTLVENMGL